MELVDNKSNNVMNGIAFGQSSQARYIKTKQSLISAIPLKKTLINEETFSYK